MNNEEGNYFDPPIGGEKQGSVQRTGPYIYAIIETSRQERFGNLGIGGKGDGVYTVHYNNLAAVVSASPIVKYPVSRDNTIAHQKVLEEVMRKFTLLPVRYCTIAEEEEDIKKKVLKARYKEFKDLLSEMKDKVELGVRAIWTNMEQIFGEIGEENKDIKQLKEKVAKETSLFKRREGMMKVGEMVKEALEEKKEKEAQELLAVLKPLSVDARVNKVYGDRNILSAAFLVKKAKEEEFGQKIKELAEELNGRTRLRYFGPVPPYNFVEVIITW